MGADGDVCNYSLGKEAVLLNVTHDSDGSFPRYTITFSSEVKLAERPVTGQSARIMSHPSFIFQSLSVSTMDSTSDLLVIADKMSNIGWKWQQTYSLFIYNMHSVTSLLCICCNSIQQFYLYQMYNAQFLVTLSKLVGSPDMYQNCDGNYATKSVNSMSTY